MSWSVKRSVPLAKQTPGRVAQYRSRLRSRLLLPWKRSDSDKTFSEATCAVPAQDEVLELRLDLPRYTHESLNTTERQIRLFRLLKEKTHDGHLQGYLDTFDLADGPEYTALSYTWKKPRHPATGINGLYLLKEEDRFLEEGPEPRRYTLSINGRGLLIHENLYEFLTIFREITENVDLRWLWIDEICIDQDTVKERNHQVSLMSAIYTGCSKVIAWLGNHDTWSWSYDPDMPIHLWEHPYFGRLWIIQELLLPNAVPSFLCGRTWLDSTDAIEKGFVLEGLKHVCHLFLSKPYSTMPLEFCLTQFWNAKCSEPRDSLYGFLGLIEAEQRPLVDYEKSLEEVFLDAVLAILNTCAPKVTSSSSDDIESCFRYLFKNLGLDGNLYASSPTVQGASRTWHHFRASLVHSGVTRYCSNAGQEQDIKRITAVGYEDNVWWHEHHGQRIYSNEITAVARTADGCMHIYEGEVYQDWPSSERGSDDKPLPLSREYLDMNIWFDICGRKLRCTENGEWEYDDSSKFPQQ